MRFHCGPLIISPRQLEQLAFQRTTTRPTQGVSDLIEGKFSIYFVPSLLPSAFCLTFLCFISLLFRDSQYFCVRVWTIIFLCSMSWASTMTNSYSDLVYTYVCIYHVCNIHMYVYIHTCINILYRERKLSQTTLRCNVCQTMGLTYSQFSSPVWIMKRAKVPPPYRLPIPLSR